MSYRSPDLPLAIPVDIGGAPVEGNFDCGGPFRIKLWEDHAFDAHGVPLRLKAGDEVLVVWAGRHGGHLKVNDGDIHYQVSRKALVVLLRELHGPNEALRRAVARRVPLD